MPVFHYTALDRGGQRIAGEMQGPSREVVIRQLSDAGHFPIDVVAGDGGAPAPTRARSSTFGRIGIGGARSRSSRASWRCCSTPGSACRAPSA